MARLYFLLGGYGENLRSLALGKFGYTVVKLNTISFVGNFLIYCKSGGIYGRK